MALQLVINTACLLLLLLWMGSDGTDPVYGAPFEGNDPVRTASNTFQNPTLAPEPSRVLFLALGGIGLLMRRRRE